MRLRAQHLPGEHVARNDCRSTPPARRRSLALMRSTNRPDDGPRPPACMAASVGTQALLGRLPSAAKPASSAARSATSSAAAAPDRALPPMGSYAPIERITRCRRPLLRCRIRDQGADTDIEEQHGHREDPWLADLSQGYPGGGQPRGICVACLRCWKSRATSSATSPAFSNMGKTLTYERDRPSQRRLRGPSCWNELKLKKGDRVAMMMPNVLQYPIAHVRRPARRPDRGEHQPDVHRRASSSTSSRMPGACGHRGDRQLSPHAGRKCFADTADQAA